MARVEHAGRRPTDADVLAQRAQAVLTANQRGWTTRPSPRLYPHQWSWDAAFIAMAYAHYDQERAQRELLSLFEGQWGNGMVPHIVFSEGSAAYFPGSDFWQTERSPHAPTSKRTSGIVQPPVHATAVLAIHRHASDRDAAEAFVAEMVPRLAAWHDHLHRERTRDGGLVEIWHPWESGMDNSPLWDDALARIELAPADVPVYQRVDVTVAHAVERPTDAEYDRYAYLVALFREHRYDPAAIRDVAPFAVRDALFNAILVQADRDLAALARVVGDDPDRFEQRAERTARTLDEQLWDPDAAAYLDWDVRADAPIATRTAAGYAPLYAGVPDADRAERIVDGLRAAGVRPGVRGYVLPSLSPEDPRFRPTRYWRGPVWPVINWLACRGLARYGHLDDAELIRSALVDLAREHGFFEHYHPRSGEGHGGEQFAWTAALIVDLLSTDPSAP